MMGMDKTVIILIATGVCCAVIGLALFIKLLTTKPDYDEEETRKRKLLDPEYPDNFEECFKNAENIEETLDQLAHVYTGNQFMYNLIVSAIDYLNDGEGDYETALEKINVDSDIEIMKMHNAAIKKALNIEKKSEKAESKEENAEPQSNSEAVFEDSGKRNPQTTNENKVVASIADEEEDEFEEDEEEESSNMKVGLETQKKEMTQTTDAHKTDTIEQNSDFTSDESEGEVDDDDDDLDGFKIG